MHGVPLVEELIELLACGELFAVIYIYTSYTFLPD